MKIFLAFTALVASAAGTAIPWTSCGTSADMIQVNSVEATPWPPVGGEDLTVSIDANIGEQITDDATYDVSAKVFGIKVFSQSGKLADLDVPADTFPVSAGPFVHTKTVPLPNPPVSGTAKVHFVAHDAAGNELICGDATVKISKRLNLFTDVEYESLFQSWAQQHGKEFHESEIFSKFEIFKKNLDMIREHNAGDHSWTMGMNEFGAMTTDEFFSTMVGFGGVPKREWNAPVEEFQGVQTPASQDWTAKGAVTPVKNQGQCGSCWAFSTTGSLEGAYQIKNGNLVSFSEQELVDCDHNGDQACNGGLMDNAFSWIQKNGGICKESDYRYMGKKESCSTSCQSVNGTKITKWTDVGKSEKALEAAVAQQPVSIAIEADQSSFQFYKSGVMTKKCGTSLDHGVLAVGYGVDNGQKYWKVKNSWGGSWGESGYIRLAKGISQRGGQCGLLNSASYPSL